MQEEEPAHILELVHSGDADAVTQFLAAGGDAHFEIGGVNASSETVPSDDDVRRATGVIGVLGLA